MEKFVVQGGKKLKGEIAVSGAKNVALKALVAACLTEEEVIINNIPLISDFFVMTKIIRELGGRVIINDHSVSIQIKNIKSTKISFDKAAEIRTSSMFFAPLLARVKEAIIPNPGGCRIGARPIDRTIDGLRKLNVNIKYNSGDGYFYSNTKGIKGVNYKFAKNTHTGTETLILASVLAKGKTVLENVAEEPEIDELINLLNQMGARIKRYPSRVIIINGIDKLHGTEFTVNPDRNEIVTFAIAAIITEGDIFIKEANKSNLHDFLKELEFVKGGFKEGKNGIRFYYKGNLVPTDVITSPYPGFMTDWQGPWTVLMTKANGISSVHEAVYENRFGYIEELKKMGANIKLYNPKVKNPREFYNFNLGDDKNEYFHAVKIYAPVSLHNAIVNISDLRAGATLVLASLAAKGESVILGVEHLDRGYEYFEKRLKILGADIKRIVEK